MPINEIMQYIQVAMIPLKATKLITVNLNNEPPSLVEEPSLLVIFDSSTLNI